jgi:hypothetical protein
MELENTSGTGTNETPRMEGTRLKRVSLVIKNKKYPGHSFVGYSLLHEFHPKRLSFFTDHKFPVDDILEVEVDFFGTKAKLRVLMVSVHEHISSSRVMTSIPTEANPCPIRKFYRCYAAVQSLEGILPGMAGDANGGSINSAAASTPAAETTVAADGPVVAEASAPVSDNVTPITNNEPKHTSASLGAEPGSPEDGNRPPKDSDDVRSKLAALSALSEPAVGDASDKQAA